MRKLLASLIVGLCTFEGMVQAGELRSGKAAISNSSLDSSSVTLQGNTFNAANKLVQLDAAAALPAGLKVSTASLLSGQNWLPAQLPSTAAYTNTNNNFSGTQDFSGSVNHTAPLTVNGSSMTVNGAFEVKHSSLVVGSDGKVGVGIYTPVVSSLHINEPNESLSFVLFSTGPTGGLVNTGQRLGIISYAVASPSDLHITGGPGHPISLGSNNGASIHVVGYIDGTTKIGSGGTPLAVISTGTYTPTLTSVTNLDGTTAVQATFLRVGNQVTVYGNFSADATTTLVLTNMGISLPIASDLVNDQDLGGAGSNDLRESLVMIGDVASNRADVYWTPVSTADKKFSFTFSYTIK